MGKKIILMIAVLTFTFLGACGAANSKTADKKATQTEAAGKSFLHVISTVDWKEKVKTQKSQFIYVGRPTCEDCQAFQPMLKKAAKKENLGKVDYYNVDKAAKTNKKAMKALLKKYDIDTVPTLVALSNGKVKATYSPTASQKKLETWLKREKKDIQSVK